MDARCACVPNTHETTKQARRTGGPWRKCSDTGWRGAGCDDKQDRHVKLDIIVDFHVDETELEESLRGVGGGAREG